MSIIGDIDSHESDYLIEIPEDRTVVECKTTISLVYAKEAEEMVKVQNTIHLPTLLLATQIFICKFYSF
jgi:PHP family Zn ribbon phosphoesterase